MKANYSQPYRPKFHFSPPQQWMNDPNGMVYYQGVYHLFYQHHPDSNVWGPMHWGHAVSSDLVRWENRPIALYPDEHGMIFSGSAVVDWNNTSGFGTEENPPLVAIFTYHHQEKEKAGAVDYQTQGLAYSTDGGMTWAKYAKNPVLGNPGIQDFRDPKVFWYPPNQQWVMVLAVKDHVRLYTSPNLKDWTYESEFGKTQGAHGGVWECPDLFPLVVGDTETEKWVMLLSINPGGPQGGSATQYFIGDFDGKTFIPADTLTRWLDYGADNYAGVTWADIPKEDGRRLFIGWMSNWEYANQVPTYDWRSAMTLPRTLALRNDYRLLQQPVNELTSLMDGARALPEISLDSTFKLGSLAPYHHQKFSLHLADTALFTWQLSNEEESVTLMIDLANHRVQFNRSSSGDTAFNAVFGNPHEMPLPATEHIQTVEVFVDASSIEIFLNEGAYVMTELIFPTQPYHTLTLKNEGGGTISQFIYHDMIPIWQ